MRARATTALSGYSRPFSFRWKQSRTGQPFAVSPVSPGEEGAILQLDDLSDVQNLYDDDNALEALVAFPAGPRARTATQKAVGLWVPVSGLELVSETEALTLQIADMGAQIARIADAWARIADALAPVDAPPSSDEVDLWHAALARARTGRG